MTISKLEYDLLNAVTKIEDNDDMRITALGFAQTDKQKQKIIEGIENGTITCRKDILHTIYNYR